MNANIEGLSKQTLETDAVTWASRARGLRIVDAESCQQASFLLRSVKGLRSDIASWFAPHIEAAMETKRKAEDARKALVNEKDKMEAPLVEAETVCKRALLAYESEQERLRMEQECSLQAEAQKRAEAATLAAAAALELEARATGNDDMLAEAVAIMEQPIEAPVVVVQTSMPKVQGITYRDQWKCHPEVDIKALAAAVASGAAPVTFLLPNLTAINQFARATQGVQSVAGVRFYNDRQIAARG
jgi:hypothetical protein